MGKVKLDHVEAHRDRAPSGGHEIVADPGHLGSIHLPRDLALSVEIRDRRRRHDWPIPMVQRDVVALPSELGRALSASMANLQTNLGSRILVDEPDDLGPLGLVLVTPQTGTSG